MYKGNNKETLISQQSISNKTTDVWRGMINMINLFYNLTLY